MATKVAINCLLFVFKRILYDEESSGDFRYALGPMSRRLPLDACWAHCAAADSCIKLLLVFCAGMESRLQLGREEYAKTESTARLVYLWYPMLDWTITYVLISQG